MALIKERTLNQVNTTPSNIDVYGNENGVRVEVLYTYRFDDTEDDQLPLITQKTTILYKGDDISNHDELVQTICNAVWAEEEPEV